MRQEDQIQRTRRAYRYIRSVSRRRQAATERLVTVSALLFAVALVLRAVV